MKTWQEFYESIKTSPKTSPIYSKDGIIYSKRCKICGKSCCEDYPVNPDDYLYYSDDYYGSIKCEKCKQPKDKTGGKAGTMGGEVGRVIRSTRYS